MRLLDGIIVTLLQGPALIPVLIQTVDISEQLALKHFFIFTPGKPAGIAAVNDNPGKIVSGAGSLDLIRDTLRTFGAVTVHHLVNVCIFQCCTEIKKYIDFFCHIIFFKESSVDHGDSPNGQKQQSDKICGDLMA